jgi:hypothetical protein
MRIARLLSIIPALLIVLALPINSNAQIGVGVSINIAPPALPVYEQPPLPDVGYMWTPGFWQYGPEGYYWVPGTWVQPPTVGVLWTPGYWGWANGAYAFNEGYWGPHIGFYGGVNYGFGYGGVGFEGGEWRNGGFFYNRAVVNIGGGVRVTNVYEKTVIVNNNTTRVSFNGGAGGTSARPTPTELAASRETHVPRTAEQEQHIHAASTNHAMLASVNHGAPTVAATAKPGVFEGKGVVSASHAAPASAHAPAAREQTAHAHAPAASHDAVAHPATPQAKHAAPRPAKPAPEAKPEESPAAARPEAKPEAARPAPAAAPRPAAPAPRAPAKTEEKHE